MCQRFAKVHKETEDVSPHVLVKYFTPWSVTNEHRELGKIWYLKKSAQTTILLQGYTLTHTTSVEN